MAWREDRTGRGKWCPGKTTSMLLTAAADPTEGQILLDGVDLRE